MEKLTPVYAIFFEMPNIKGYKTFTVQSDEVDEWGESITLKGSAKKMIEKAKEYVKDCPDYPVWVQHYSYKERGLKPTERPDSKKIFEYLPIESGFRVDTRT
jgi:hypothetical protein